MRQFVATLAIFLLGTSCSDHRSPTEAPIPSFISGVVFEADGGRALGGVPVSIAEVPTTTDAAGRFSGEASVGSFVQVEAKPVAGVPPSQSFGLKIFPGDNILNIPIVGGGMHWWGVVRDSTTGIPIEGALVSTPWGDQRTDQTGLFLQRIDTRSTVVFGVSAPGYVDHSEISRGSSPRFFHVLLVRN